jgi:hypothetical protein
LREQGRAPVAVIERESVRYAQQAELSRGSMVQTPITAIGRRAAIGRLSMYWIDGNHCAPSGGERRLSRLAVIQSE